MDELPLVKAHIRRQDLNIYVYIYISHVIIIKNYLPHNSTHKVIVYGYKNCYLCFYLPTTLSYK